MEISSHKSTSGISNESAQCVHHKSLPSYVKKGLLKKIGFVHTLLSSEFLLLKKCTWLLTIFVKYNNCITLFNFFYFVWETVWQMT